jgi:excisionase family DNA binding protein
LSSREGVQVKSNYFTVNETADYFNISKSMVRKMIRECKVKFYRVGRKILIKLEDFEAAMVPVETTDKYLSDLY